MTLTRFLQTVDTWIQYLIRQAAQWYLDQR